ncbi:MAG: hypothetical protein QN175_11435 [Armatimonadota bacterium]|nr:hypothetical protein [Armatimonadota bacterium]MDR7463080.1 hypothetical protein [Armatimonadota bacterium]MDR7475604.1 hypothetical protein [Armatimonadota bacterium]
MRRRLLLVLGFTLLSFFPEDVSQAQEVRGVEVVRARFGAGPDALGVITPREGNPEGPMSFDLGRNGEIFVLDQVNSRVQVFRAGERRRTIRIPGQTFVDVAIASANRIVLLDNLVKKAVYVLTSEGRVLNIVPLEGRSISYAPAVEGVYSREDGKWAGVWVEVEERSVRIAAPHGAPMVNRISVPGRFNLDGRRLMRAGKIGDTTAVVYLSKEDSLAQWSEYTVSFPMFIAHLLGLWDDRKGRIYLGAFLEEGSAASNVVVILGPQGRELGRVRLFVQRMPHEVYRSVRVSPEGKIFQMALGARGVFVKVFDPGY